MQSCSMNHAVLLSLLIYVPLNFGPTVVSERRSIALRAHPSFLTLHPAMLLCFPAFTASCFKAFLLDALCFSPFPPILQVDTHTCVSQASYYHTFVFITLATNMLYKFWANLNSVVLVTCKLWMLRLQHMLLFFMHSSWF